MTCKKYRNNYFKSFRKLGLDFKTCIDIKTTFKRNGDIRLSLDQLCTILDKHGYKHSLEHTSFDDLERYYAKYYKEYWINNDSYLLVNGVIKINVRTYTTC